MTFFGQTLADMYLTCLIGVWAFMTVLWLISLLLRDASIIDAFWPVSFLWIAGICYFFGNGSAVSLGLVLLMALWAIRLGIYLFLRNRKEGEDLRYQKMRHNGGRLFWLRSYTNIFLFQGLISLIVAMPMVLAGSRSGDMTAISYAAAILFLAGWTIEAVADHQLSYFRSNPDNKGKTMQSGIWSWSRHPNYFGNAVMMWGMGLMVLQSWTDVWCLAGPAIMTFFLIKVSGVAMTERHMKQTRVDWVAYAERTSMFIPLPPKSH